MRDTAVQWYHKQIGFLFQQWHNHQITISEFHFKRLELQHQAKEIEKEQIEEAFGNGVDDEYEYHINNHPRTNSEQYYNETYGGNK